MQGVIDEEKLDMFNMPCYFPTVEEVKQLVEAEGSFTVDKLETFTLIGVLMRHKTYVIGWSLLSRA